MLFFSQTPRAIFNNTSRSTCYYITTMHTAVEASAFLSLDGAIIESLREIKWPPLRQAVNFSSYLSIELLQYRECI